LLTGCSLNHQVCDISAIACDLYLRRKLRTLAPVGIVEFTLVHPPCTGSPAEPLIEDEQLGSCAPARGARTTSSGRVPPTRQASKQRTALSR